MKDVLWTDLLFLGLLFIGSLSLLFRLRDSSSRAIMRKLFDRPLAICSAVILFIFLSIAVFDSIRLTHPELPVGNFSLLDKWLAPLGQSYEKTYSAPFALTLFTREVIYKNGQIAQIYPRLEYLPSHIQTHQERNQLIVRTVLQAAGISAFVLLILLIGAWRWLSSQYLVAIGTACLCLFLIIASYKLSRDFHIFGTGKIGQDIFYYTIKSIRTGLVIGTLTTLIMLPLAILFGIAAGYFGGYLDDMIQYIYTTLSSIPGVLLITASVLSMQTYIANHPAQFSTMEKSADARLIALCLILGVTSWTSLCRLLRAEALKYREIDFIIAAKALGASAWRILYRHILPNVMPMVLIIVVLDFSSLVLAEAVLSYVGVGVSPTTISWGNMINGARLELAREPVVWWPMLAAFLFMFTLVLASNIFADSVRDALDPHG